MLNQTLGEFKIWWEDFCTIVFLYNSFDQLTYVQKRLYSRPTTNFSISSLFETGYPKLIYKLRLSNLATFYPNDVIQRNNRTVPTYLKSSPEP